MKDMKDMKQLMKEWDKLNDEVAELTCLSEIITYAANMGEGDEIVRLNIGGAMSLLNRSLDDMYGRYQALLLEVEGVVSAN